MLRQRRDASAIEPLFEAHFDGIHRYATCRVGSEVALDVTAETYAQALRSAGKLDPQRDARAWLFGIAANVLRHHRRAEARRLRAYERAGTDRDAGQGAAPYDNLSDRPGLIDALQGLEPRDREAILLLAWADLSYEEIADALDIPLGTVRSRINRARRILRSALTPLDVPERLAGTVAMKEEA